MKIRSILTVLIVISTCLSHAQELNLKIKGTESRKIVLEFNGNPLPAENAAIKIDDIKQVEVTSSAPAAVKIKVLLFNTEASQDTITLAPGQTTKIANRQVEGSNFKLANKVGIRVLLNGKVEKSFFMQDSSAGGAVNSGGTGNGGGNPTAVSGEYQPGSFVYDAVTLADKNTSVVLKLKILSFYANGEGAEQLGEFYKDNKFLDSLVRAVAGTNLVQGNLSLNGLLSSVGNADVTKFADGLAKFIVARSKEELNIAFFRKFQEFIRAYPEVQVVFPTTYKFLMDIYSYQYAAMLPALRAGFQKDLNAFSKNLIALRDLSAADCPTDNQKCKDRLTAINVFLNNNPAGRGIIAGLIVSNNILEGNNAAETLNNLANDPVFQHSEENVSNIVQFTNLISQSMVSHEAGRVWVTKTEIGNLLKNEAAIKIYLGLVFNADKKRGANNIRFNIGNPAITTTLQQYINNLHDNWASLNFRFRTDFGSIANSAASVSSLTDNITTSEAKGQESSILIYANYASALSTFLKASILFIGDANLFPGFEKLKDDMLHFTRIIDPATDACYDIKSQNYSALVMHTSEILAEILDSNYTFKEEFIRYGTFMANVVEAKNSDEVKEAIEAIVLPVGSASIKRETDFNIALNAYIGPFAGTEYMPVLKKKKASFVTGLTAPVGPAFSWGNLGRKGQLRSNGREIGGKSITLFVPLIDIGAMAAFRLGDDSSNVASEVKLKNILSPGLFVYYGFGKCPISLGLGGQLGPQLRGVNAKDINVDKNYYFRFSISVLVDIPLFNIYTKATPKTCCQ
ncbi:hypothetical protein A3860_13640 [Niastella vici]|uniref:Uncharacterized protein n=1 Tax=Niastella vici TaxID=1703345 RepID=A0A1V9G7G8_9BACT|nr:hypothetical protein [Niastella vici]OQP66522.1 hypothetical protein A3860_13640 [Niastella vici]